VNGPEVKRRHGRVTDAQGAFDAAVYARLPWPGKTTRLERDSLRDLVERSTSTQVSVAELYHENSKLFAARRAELLCNELDVGALRREFVRRRTATRRSLPAYDSSHPVRTLLTSVAREVDAELFYALDLRVVLRGAVLLHDPGLDVLIEYARADLDEKDPQLFVVASFARNELLYGTRGYRHTLLEAGRLAQQLVSLAGRAALDARLSFDFDDWELNAALQADGVEEGVIVAVELKEVRDVAQG
jgi:hypothetical protein